MTDPRSRATLSTPTNGWESRALPARASLGTRLASLLLRPHVILLLMLGLFLSRGITQGEPFYLNDETRHMMNGVFFRDLLVDRPLSHPMQYAYGYYAKYPALAIPHWPPLFAFVEAIFFLVFGISVWASRLAILGFALLGAYFWYRIAERYGSPSRALLTVFVFCLLPPVMVFESVTTLEIPQVALCLGTIHFWLRWRESERARDLWATAGFAAAAMLTYQMSVFLALFLGIDFLLERRFRVLLNWQVWAALTASLAVVLPWYLLSSRTLTLSYQRVVGHGFQHVANSWTMLYYLRTLPSQLGPILLVLATIGIGWTLFRAARQYRFLLLWIVSAYLCFTLILEKDARHILIWLPPLTYFSVLGVEALWPSRRWLWLPYAALASYFFVGALLFHRPRFTGLEQVARFVLAQPESDIIYYQGNLDGDFIYYVRQLDPQKRHMVARDKLVQVTNVVYAQRAVLETSSQILDLFRTWGIRYAVMESAEHSPGLAVVRDLVHSDQFELVATFTVHGKDAYEKADKIYVYRYRGQIQRSTQPVDIPMMTIRQNIHADLNRLAGRPWPN
jgi:hypothetical protein